MNKNLGAIQIAIMQIVCIDKQLVTAKIPLNIDLAILIILWNNMVLIVNVFKQH